MRTATTWFVTCAAMWMLPTIFGTEFRVQNTVTAVTPEVTSEVVSQTIFVGAVVYNFIDPHGEITVIDPQSDLFVLIDPALRIQTRFSISALCATVDQKREELASHRVPLVAFAANPKFQVTLEEASDAMKFTSDQIDYHLETVRVADDAILAAYSEAADAFCYLNFRLQPGTHGLIYLSRLAVNRELREKHRVPEKIRVLYYQRGKGLLAKPEERSSVHVYFMRLSDADRKRLDQAQQMMKTFREVPFSEYQVEADKRWETFFKETSTKTSTTP